MKKISRLIPLLLCLALLLCMAICVLAADPATAPAVIPAVPATVPAPSIIDWFTLYKAYIFGAALAISELLGVTPWFKGNGIMDTIIKGLKLLMGKDAPA